MPYGWEGFAGRLADLAATGYEIGRKKKERAEDVEREEKGHQAAGERYGSERQREEERYREERSAREIADNRAEQQRVFDRALAERRIRLEERRAAARPPGQEQAIAAKIGAIGAAEEDIAAQGREQGRRWYKPWFMEKEELTPEQKSMSGRLAARRLELLGMSKGQQQKPAEPIKTDDRASRMARLRSRYPGLSRE